MAIDVNWGYAAQQLISAGVVGAFYALLAVAYALLHGITNRIVLSFGDVAMFGSFAAFYAITLMLSLGIAAGLAMAAGFALAAASAAAAGSLVQSQVFNGLLRSPSQAIMIASIGVSIVIQEIMRIQSHGQDQWLPPMFNWPILDAGTGFSVRATLMQALALGSAVALFAGLYATLRFTRAGRLWRAVSQNPRLAALSGIDSGRVIGWTAVTAAGFAAASGWIVATAYGGIAASMGLMLGFKAMFASIIGGFGTIGGAIAGGFTLGLLETLWVAYFPAAYRDVAVFGAIILILILRPDGLLGVSGRRESEV